MSEIPTARLFCALDPPAGVATAIADWQRDSGAASRGWRPVPTENLHLTLAFLGRQPSERVEAIATAVEGLSAGPVPARLLAEPVPVPVRAPRLLALEVEGQGIEPLAEHLRSDLEAIGALSAAERAEGSFWPHITVLRRSHGAAGASRAARIGPLPEANPGSGHAFGFVRVALYRSEIRPEGSSYSRLAARDLPQPGGLQKR